LWSVNNSNIDWLWAKFMTKTIEITNDYFLEQALRITQPAKGYRAGIDAVLLGAAASANENSKKIAELGSGVGVAILSAIWRLKSNEINALAIEKDGKYFELLQQNIVDNGFENILAQNIDGLKPHSQIENKFDLVISNPPFFDDNSTIRDPDMARQSAYIIGQPLEKWIIAMLRLCYAKGDILIIHRADRMTDILNALKNRAGDVRILPIHPKTTQNANRIIVRAKKASKAPTQILPSLFLRDIENDGAYLPEIDRLCRGENLGIFKGLFE
jgi:tRNA1(Val) A37 N6-methylase TrmN6